jgi:THAP4-like, heme-binding beta-barrel domain
MAFTIPEGLHEELYPLAWLVGTWRGSGVGEYPGIERFEFFHEVTFNHDGRNFLNYYSRSWLTNEAKEILKPLASEVGFWRPRPKNVLEISLAHSTGIAESWVGVYDGPKIQLVMDKGIPAPSAKVVEEGTRLYGLVEGQLFFAYDMAYGGHPLQAHIWSTMERQSNG